MRSSIPALALVLLLAPYSARAQDGDIASGVYSDAMLIGFDPVTRIASGYFNSSTGRGQYSCIFYLRGKLRDHEVAISTYFPEAPTTDLIKGELVLDGHQHFRVRLRSDHGGCWNVTHFADDEQPAEFALQTAYAWTSVAVVKSDRAYFFDTPDSPTHRKGYVVRGDGVGIRAARPGWLQVDFVGRGSDKAVSGWIRQSDVYPVD